MRKALIVMLAVAGCAESEPIYNECGAELYPAWTSEILQAYNDAANAACFRELALRSGGQVTDCVPVGGGMTCVTR
jgi:hypothetical protein